MKQGEESRQYRLNHDSQEEGKPVLRNSAPLATRRLFDDLPALSGTFSGFNILLVFLLGSSTYNLINFLRLKTSSRACLAHSI